MACTRAGACRWADETIYFVLSPRVLVFMRCRKRSGTDLKTDMKEEKQESVNQAWLTVFSRS